MRAIGKFHRPSARTTKFTNRSTVCNVTPQFLLFFSSIGKHKDFARMRSARAQRRRRTSSSNSSSVYPKNPRSRERPWGSLVGWCCCWALLLSSLFFPSASNHKSRARGLSFWGPRAAGTQHIRERWNCAAPGFTALFERPRANKSEALRAGCA